jgi:hypothetical protein
MNTHADKTQENKSQSVSNTISQKQGGGESTFQFVDNRPESIFQRKLQEMANNHSLQQQQPIQKKENNIGLPDNLKSGIENLSGYSMDDVKVHYNSDKPAQLQAHAYAQGTDIHLASGQEKHLPHEAWHVVQQKQGRVKPTTQLKGKVAINDDTGLEKEADVMGAKALSLGNNTTTLQAYKLGFKTNTTTVQLERKYDETLTSEKVILMEWLVDRNKTLGISQEGEDKTGSTQGNKNNKKSNFSWHHIAAFADLSKYGEGKTDPANHGGNLRLGPMKNRSEANDVSGGTALDYGYSPLDGDGNITLDDYSKSLFDGSLKVTDESGMRAKLTQSTHADTPQTKNMVRGDDATSSFSEWFMDVGEQHAFLSDAAIEGKLDGTEVGERPAFIAAINSQLASLRRTYKYYNKKKQVQITSGVPMTNISEGTFGHITIACGDETIKASTVIDELLRNQEWISRGSQGPVQDVSTTYKFGLADHPDFTQMIKGLVANVDLATYGEAKFVQFRMDMAACFDVIDDKQSDTFDGAKEARLVGLLDDNIRGGAQTYDTLWAGIDATEIAGQYVKSVINEDAEDWNFPVPDDDKRLSIIEETVCGEAKEITAVWVKLFTDKLKTWDKKESLILEDTDPHDQLLINFEDVEKSIDENEGSWQTKDINKARRGKMQINNTFLTSQLTLNTIKNAIADIISKDIDAYFSDDFEDLTLDDVKEALKNEINGKFNVCLKRIKGVEKDYGKRQIAFGAELDGYVTAIKWHLINSNALPTEVGGLDGKKWADLGDVQTTYYNEWIKQRGILEGANALVTSESLIRELP